ncbi:hypothetical protein AEB_P0048 [Altererythrobacter sp. B11]|uniref:hypothetical protein n=1 Tax=Altererythrobacter sp. B11 TaxID=2060312 RepID=UPI000DC737E1|nr:hypothetical protein [Altererythrobacter sp. B11]BBC70916.1 hypothetical protein AEB_P0048 [Altererythrobacter sp. B11]
MNDAATIVQEARICLLASAVIKDSADPADALVVLLSGPLSLMHGELFEPTAFIAKVKEQFGWSVSADAAEYFIPKLRKLGWLKSRSDFPSRGPFYVDLAEAEQETDRVNETRDALIEIGTAFRSFASELSPINALPDDPMEAGAVLLRYVVDANAPLEGTVSPRGSDADYLSARFVEHVNKKRLPARDVLSSLSAVGFLFRVAEEIGNPSKRRTINLKVVVDGPVILDYLGCSGEIRSEASVDVFESLRAMGASTVTFAHCVEEARDALRSVLKANPRDRYGPTGEALRKGWVNENALLSLLQAFDVAVRKKGIEILPDTPDFMPSSHVYFDMDRARGIDEIINWHDEENGNARYADADTTVLTIRRRAGYRTSDLFESRYVCVTTNDIFARATKRHLLEIAYYNARQTPPIITLKELAAKLWIEIGNRGAASRFKIPNSQLLLSCDRSLRLNRKVVDRARAELAKIKPEQVEQFELLLEVPRSARAVMDATLNNERYVSGATIEQLVEAAVDAAGEEVAAKEKARRIKEHEQFKRQLAEVEQKLEAEQLRAEKTEQSAACIAEEKASNDIATLDALARLIHRVRPEGLAGVA